MDFRFDRDELAMIAGIAEVFQRDFPLARLRQDRPDTATWSGLVGGGWLHAGLAEADGGLAIPRHMQSAFAREAGRALLVEAWTNNAVLIPRLIAGISDQDERERWLERHLERPGFLVADGRGLELRATDTGRVEWCFGVEPGWDAYAIDPSGASLVRITDANISLDAIGGLAAGVGTVTVDGGERATAGLASPPPDAVLREAELIHSAALVGLAERARDITVDHVKLREQFGRPIGQFQAPKHMLADVHVLTEVAWNACLYASLRGDVEPESSDAARVQAAEAATAASQTMLQLHGGMGFTWESDVHFFLKTALTGAFRFGSRDERALSLGRAAIGS